MPTSPQILCFYDDYHEVASIGLPTTQGIYQHTTDLRNVPIIRWGKSELATTRSRPHKEKEFPYVLNPSKAIQRNVKKKHALTMMSQVVATPRIFTREVPAGVTAVVRPT